MDVVGWRGLPYNTIYFTAVKPYLMVQLVLNLYFLVQTEQATWHLKLIDRFLRYPNFGI